MVRMDNSNGSGGGGEGGSGGSNGGYGENPWSGLARVPVTFQAEIMAAGAVAQELHGLMHQVMVAQAR